MAMKHGYDCVSVESAASLLENCKWQYLQIDRSLAYPIFVKFDGILTPIANFSEWKV